MFKCCIPIRFCYNKVRFVEKEGFFLVPLSGSDVSAQDIEQLLRTLGASPVYAGFTPAVTALQYVLADQQLLTSLTTRLYPKVAESCEIALPCVERNIRTMIAVIWEKNQFLFQIVVGYRMTARPSVGDFLASLSTFLMYHPAKDWPDYLR